MKAIQTISTVSADRLTAARARDVPTDRTTTERAAWRLHPWIAAMGLAGFVLLTGCANPGEAPPPMLRAAAGQSRIGEEAYLAGRPAKGVPALAEAVRLHLAAGDLPGAAHGLLNLALAQRGAGDVAAAAATAERLHDLIPAARQQAQERGGAEDPSPDLAAASTWLEALLAVDRGDSAAAASLLGFPTEKLPAASPWTGRLETLRAEVALGDGRFADAIARAEIGQAASAAAHDRAEEARALRLAGAAHVRLGHWIEARAKFLASVRVEETLGGGARMAGDLAQLATIAEHLGDTAEAELYTRRARAITAARNR